MGPSAGNSASIAGSFWLLVTVVLEVLVFSTLLWGYTRGSKWGKLTSFSRTLLAVVFIFIAAHFLGELNHEISVIAGWVLWNYLYLKPILRQFRKNTTPQPQSVTKQFGISQPQTVGEKIPIIVKITNAVLVVWAVRGVVRLFYSFTRIEAMALFWPRAAYFVITVLPYFAGAFLAALMHYRIFNDKKHSFTKTLLKFFGIAVAYIGLRLLEGAGLELIGYNYIPAYLKIRQWLIIGIIVAFLIYGFVKGRGKSKTRSNTKVNDLGLPVYPDPNVGYIKGARFGVKNPLHQIAWYTHIQLHPGVDLREAFNNACLKYGARPNDNLFNEVKKILDTVPINIGDILIPPDAETKGFLLVGRPGTGKTQIISQVLDALMARGEKTLVHDHKADYLTSFYRPETDVIFNPLDARCVPWDIFSHVVGPWDLESIATALIPPPPGNTDQHWTDAARNVLIGAMTYLVQEGRACNEELKKLIADKNELAKIIIDSNLRGAEHLIGFPDNKESQSVMSTFGRFSNCLAYLPNTSYGDKGCTFDFEEWINADDAGTIFVTNYQRTEDALRPLLSLFIESFIRTVLSLPDDLDRRIYILLDEFGRLNRLPSTSSLITQGRSKGCCTFLGIQDLAQIETKYSRTIRQSIANSLGSHVVLQVVDPETADYFSREFGEVTRWRTDYTETQGQSSATSLYSLGGSHTSTSSRTHQVTERLILPSEILGLQKLQAIVRLVDKDVLATTIPILSPPTAAESFILNEKFAFKKETTGEAEQAEQNRATHTVEVDGEIEDL